MGLAIAIPLFVKGRAEISFGNVIGSILAFFRRWHHCAGADCPRQRSRLALLLALKEREFNNLNPIWILFNPKS